jgi:hypothetical protein
MSVMIEMLAPKALRQTGSLLGPPGKGSYSLICQKAGCGTAGGRW